MIMYMTEMSMHAKVGENGPETSKHISMKAMTKVALQPSWCIA